MFFFFEAEFVYYEMVTFSWCFIVAIVSRSCLLLCLISSSADTMCTIIVEMLNIIIIGLKYICLVSNILFFPNNY